jgi:phosphonate degradation associated HDIG domain protein
MPQKSPNTQNGDEAAEITARSSSACHCFAADSARCRTCFRFACLFLFFMKLDLAEIARLFAERGDVAYAGEPVSQTEHALQCAWLAEQAGASDALVTAALLHDLGHLLIAEHQTLSRSPTELGIDDRHQYIALPLLRGAFDAEVREPIRLHVDAKRYLCATRAGYFSKLSPDSVRSLALQGGPMDDEAARRFASLEWAADAVRLRLWDEQAKADGLKTPPLAHFLATAARVMLR